MYVRHYITKSAAEYKVAKYRRSNAAAPYSVTDEQYFFKYNKKTKEKEDLLKKGSSVEVRGRLEKRLDEKAKANDMSIKLKAESDGSFSAADAV